MPELTKPAIDLLQDLDLETAKQINPQHLDLLIDHLQKSAVAENRVPLLRSPVAAPGRARLDQILKRRFQVDAPPEAETPKFEVVKTAQFSQQTGLTKAFDLNQIFTVPSQVLGPFPTLDGPPIYYNFYQYIDDFKVFFPGEALAAFIIPVRFSRIVLVNSRVSSLTLSKGNMWIRADLLDPAAGATNYVGLKILSGTLGLGGSFPHSSNSIQIPKNSILDIAVNLDNSYVAEASDDTGLDGRNSSFKPPENIRLKTLGGKLQLAENETFSGKTLAWSGNLRNRAMDFFWDAERKYLCLKLTTDDIHFTAGENASKLYDIRGEATIMRSLWMLPSRILNQNQSVEVKFNGVLSLSLSKGLLMKWDGLREAETDVKANECEVLFLNGLFNLHSEKANMEYLHDHLSLWQKSPEKPVKMELEVRFMDYMMLQILSQSNTGDSVSAYADTTFFIDKPLRADNTPVKPKSKKSLYAKVATKDSKGILIIDSDLLTEDYNPVPATTYYAAPPLERYQFALENAYFTTTKETTLLLNAKYDDANHLYEGKLWLNYGIFTLQPTLPHPYTTNGLLKPKREQQFEGYLQAITTWETQDNFTGAEVTFKMNREFADTETTFYEDLDGNRRQNKDFVFDSSFMLFDVSTQADHWGVALSFQNREMMRKLYQDDVVVNSENVVTINRNYLQAPMGFLNGLTLPQVSWEPVLNITPPETPVDPSTGILVQKNNSIPTIFSQIDNKPVKIHPKDYIQTFRRNLKNESGGLTQNLQSKILFTLPNGKYSVASLNPYINEAMSVEGHLDFIMPQFENQNQKFRGGIQFRIASYKNPNPDAPPRLKGKTAQLRSLINSDISILGETVTNIFNNVFNGVNQYYEIGVPITHMDFSGYGASTFSDWRNPLVKFASISQAKFNILKGRTAHEIVQAVSVIYPWGICVTRTVTFFRNNNAVIFREDSGWVAQSEGFFDFSFSWVNGSTTTNYPGPYDIYPGMIQGLFKVRNIREDYNDVVKFSYNLQNGDYYLDKTTNTIQTNHTGTVEVEFVAVHFDSDVQLDAVDQKVTGTHFKGYLQVKPEGIPIPARVLREVLSKSQTPISGNIDVLLPVEKTLQKFKANAVEVKSSYQNDNQTQIAFVGEVKGSVILPADGSWSVVEVDQTTGTVQNLENGTSVGLIKDGLRPKTSGSQYISTSTKTLLAFPDALKNTAASFNKTYGLLQNTDTQKLLLKSVEYAKGQTEKYTSDPALLADCWRLMNSKGPFPNLADAITLENGAKTVMNLLPEGVQKVFNLKVPDNFSFDVIGKEGDAFRIYLKYTSIDKSGEPTSKSVIDYVTDSDSVEKWMNQMHNITVAVDLAMFKPIMYISGDFGNGKKFSPTLESGSGPQLKLDKTLQTIYDILEFLANLDPTQPSEAIKKGLKIAMSNSADSWEYKFKADKEIPLVKFPFDPINYNSPTTPLKMDAFFKMGVYFNQPIKIPETIDQIKPSVGAFLQLGADLRVMCVSVAAATIYAVGRAEVGLAADLNTPPTLHFKFGFGVELAVGLPVVGSVAVTYMVGIDMTINSVELIVGAFIYFRGRVEIFGGIVTVTISIEAAGQVQKKLGPGKPTNCVARCTFALDISIAFVININFTETWEETRQIS